MPNTYDTNGALLISLAGVVLDHEHSAPGDGGPLAVGVTDTDLTAGSVWFAGVGGLLQQDNANLFWDDGNNWLGVGAAPTGTLTVDGEVRITGADAFAANVAQLYISGSSGLVITGTAGTTYDIVILESAGNVLFANPIGTNNVYLGVSGGDVGISKALPARKLHATDNNANGAIIIPIVRLESQVSGGAGAVGHGPGLEFTGETTTTEDTLMSVLAARWSVATHASRRSRFEVRNYYIANEVLQVVIEAPDTGVVVDGNARGVGAIDIVGGRTNAAEVASGDYSVVFGGIGGRATQWYSICIGGLQNHSTATGSVAIGAQCRATAAYAVALNYQSNADVYGKFACANGNFSALGDAQRAAFVTRLDQAAHVVNTWYSLFLDGAAAQAVIPASTAWTFRALVVGLTANAAQQFSYEVVGLIERDNAGNTTLAASTTTTIFESDANYDCQAIADNVNEALEIQVRRTGGVDYSVQWVAVIHTVECTH